MVKANDWMNFINNNASYMGKNGKYTGGRYKEQRLGQAFCNHFDVKDAEVFYCENDQAVLLIHARWIDFSHNPVSE